MSHHTKSLGDIFAFNATLVHLGLEDMTDEHARWRMRDGEGSSILFLVGHMLSSRVVVLNTLGHETDNPYKERFGSTFRPLADDDEISVAELARQWDEIAEKLAAALGQISEDQALAPVEGYPIPDQTVRGALMFRAWHESYHTGQLGLMRTELGYQALRERLVARREQGG